MGVVVCGGLVAVDPAGWQAFGPVKWLVVTVTSWMAGALASKRGVDLHRPSAVSWMAFLGWAAFTSIVALDPLSAWLGTPDRRFGMVALATMAVAFLAGQAVDDPAGRGVVSRWAVAALGLMSVYGVLEALGVPPVESTITTTRLGSTLGSPAYLGAALCLVTPIAWGAAAEEQSRPWRLAAVVAGSGGLFLLAGAATRAALIGLAAALVVALRSMAPALRRRAGIAAAAALMAVAGLTLSPLGARLVEADAGGRLDEWKIAAGSLASRPVVGVGLEGYRGAFPSHVSSDYVRAYGRDTVTDRAHSGPLDMGVSTGLVGAAAWLAAAVWLTIRAWRVSRIGGPVVTGMAAGVVALIAQELFLFPTVEVGVGGWAVAGMVVASDPSGDRVRLRPSAAAQVAMVVVAVAALVAGAADIGADHRAATAMATGDLDTADGARRLRPDSFRYALVAADVAIRAGSPTAADDRLDAAWRLSPGDPALRLARARVVHTMVASGEVAAGQAVAELEVAVGEDPNHPELRLLFGDLLAEAGDTEAAERAWLAAEELAPDDPDPPLRLAALYLAVERPDLAGEALERARMLDPEHPEVDRLERIIDES